MVLTLWGARYPATPSAILFLFYCAIPWSPTLSCGKGFIEVHLSPTHPAGIFIPQCLPRVACLSRLPCAHEPPSRKSVNHGTRPFFMDVPDHRWHIPQDTFMQCFTWNTPVRTFQQSEHLINIPVDNDRLHRLYPLLSDNNLVSGLLPLRLSTVCHPPYGRRSNEELPDSLLLSAAPAPPLRHSGRPTTRVPDRSCLVGDPRALGYIRV